ncbi:transcriptional repressor [Acidobacteria bacterium ACD]|nr:MAG: transcriptional repressor [Acidobacteriota bacterium]MCE7958011.1 transcriptional repressor [Acidobacteria bacterium ACB2]MDL1950495.1 transcriptional repressor [Acidobacteria bacterium ACD]
MKVSPDEARRRVDTFRQASREAGVKLTHQRLEIFQEIAASGAHPSAETVFQAVRERVPTVSRDTVYRTLWLLQELGLITTLGPRRDAVRFDANLSPHHHFVCTTCGLAEDFVSPELDALSVPEEVRALGTVIGTQVEVRGRCAGCVAREKESLLGSAEGRGTKGRGRLRAERR